MSSIKLFFVSVVVGALLAMGYFWAVKTQRKPDLGIRQIAPQLFISGQIYNENFYEVPRHGIKTIIDMRPNGEAADQLSSEDIEKLAQVNGISFSYIPVPHGPVPAASVDALAKALSGAARPVLMYCRSGNRAVRTYALCQASMEQGPSLEDINGFANRNGFDLKDLQQDLRDRIAHRVGGAK